MSSFNPGDGMKQMESISYFYKVKNNFIIEFVDTR